MRAVLLAAAAVAAFVVTMSIQSTEAEAVVCARGVRGAACAGPRGAVVAPRPAVRCRVVNGVRRCV